MLRIAVILIESFIETGHHRCIGTDTIAVHGRDLFKPALVRLLAYGQLTRKIPRTSRAHINSVQIRWNKYLSVINGQVSAINPIPIADTGLFIIEQRL